MAVKKILLQKKIENTMYDIYTKTDASIVEYVKGSGVDQTTTTVAAELASLATEIETIGGNNSDAIEALRREIFGLAEGETKANLVETYDTIKEIANYLDSIDDTNFLTDIANLKTLVGTAGDPNAEPAVPASGLIGDLASLTSRVAALEAVGATKVENSTTNGNIKINNVETVVYDDTALAGRVTANENAIGDSSNPAAGTLRKRIGDVETEIGDDNTAATVKGRITAVEDEIGDDATADTVKGRITALETVGSTKVEASNTNGNIKINGTETQVYNDTAVTTAIGAASDAADATGSLYARVAATKAVADQAATDIGATTDAASATGSLYARVAATKSVADATATSVGTTADTADATGTVYARIAATKSVADGAVTAIGDDATAGTVKGRIAALEAFDAAPVVSNVPAEAEDNVLYMVELS